MYYPINTSYLIAFLTLDVVVGLALVALAVWKWHKQRHSDLWETIFTVVVQDAVPDFLHDIGIVNYSSGTFSLWGGVILQYMMGILFIWIWIPCLILKTVNKWVAPYSFGLKYDLLNRRPEGYINFPPLPR